MFNYKLTVRGYELDSYGHVNNAVYLNYFEQARWEIFRQLNLIDKFRKKGWFLVVTEIQIRYSRELRLFDDVTISTTLEKEAPYLVFYQKMFQNDTKIKVCSATVKTLLTDKDEIKYDIPEEIMAKLKPE